MENYLNNRGYIPYSPLYKFLNSITQNASIFKFTNPNRN